MKLKKFEAKVKNAKLTCTLAHLCQGLPQVFGEYMTYCRRLEFDEKPDYAHLRGLLQGLFVDMGYEDDAQYDWVL